MSPELQTLAWASAAVVALAWFIWSIRGRKPKYPECLKCRHNLTGAERGRCPECGRAVVHPRDLTRRRRRVVQALIAFAVLAVATFGGARTFPPAWWVPRAPTWLLIDRLGKDTWTDLLIEQELVDRLTLSDGLIAWPLDSTLSEATRSALEAKVIELRSNLKNAAGASRLERLFVRRLPRGARDATYVPGTHQALVQLRTTPQEIASSIQEIFNASNHDSSVISDGWQDKAHLVRQPVLDRLAREGLALLEDKVRPSAFRAVLQPVLRDGVVASDVVLLAVGDEDLVSTAFAFVKEDGRWRLAARGPGLSIDVHHDSARASCVVRGKSLLMLLKTQTDLLAGAFTESVCGKFVGEHGIAFDLLTKADFDDADLLSSLRGSVTIPSDETLPIQWNAKVSLTIKATQETLDYSLSADLVRGEAEMNCHVESTRGVPAPVARIVGKHAVPVGAFLSPWPTSVQRVLELHSDSR